MQIKSQQMEFTSAQQKQLQLMKDSAKLQHLQAKCENIKEELESLITNRRQCLAEREVLTERINALQNELKKAKEEEYKRERKLEEVKQLYSYKNNNHLQSIYSICGYEITKFEPLENHGVQITLSYRDICYVTYVESSQVFDLIEIYPQHYNFPHIKEFLHTSQDLKGLLSCLRKFFDAALECKDKPEEN